MQCSLHCSDHVFVDNQVLGNFGQIQMIWISVMIRIYLDSHPRVVSPNGIEEVKDLPNPDQHGLVNLPVNQGANFVPELRRCFKILEHK